MTLQELKNEVKGVRFIVLDHFCGWWTKDGFTNDESKAQVFNGEFDTDEQAKAVIKGGCQLKPLR